MPSIVRVVESPDAAPVLDERPLVLWGRRVYLQRHWVDECAIAASMRQRAALPEAAPLTAHGSALLDVLLPALDEHGKPELQRVAVDTSLSRPVSLIVGGPGTGKTHTLARLLAVLLHDAVSNGRDIQVALAAPTGKAAQRMKESIEAALASDALVGNVPEGVRERLRSVRQLTIHRLLGPLPVQRQRFRHDSATPLRYDVVVLDEDDPYLVVAADKGTATFSDTANEVAADYRFWLGDAFASGGSAGYDHKALGITARGAWESVKRHFRELGADVDREPITVVGIGDMSGDVFGNGMLRSDQLCLVAAFDHRHVFVDPTPVPAVGFAERTDRKSTRLNSSHMSESRMPSSA